MNKMIRVLIVLVIFAAVFFSSFFIFESQKPKKFPTYVTDSQINLEERGEVADSPFPLSIEYMRLQDYPGSEIVVEENLGQGSNYTSHIVSYKSDGLKIYSLLTVPL